MAIDIKSIENEIADQYLFDDNKTRPWIIGFSGGKDSTLLLQLVWSTLLKIKHGKLGLSGKQYPLDREVIVICNDTLVENPRIVSFINKTLSKVEKSAVEQGLPLKVVQTFPKLEDTFWVNLLGKGYPAPNRFFRWCTERLKINPTSRFILEQVNSKGEVIILLGTRTDESATRAKSIKKHELRGKRLRKHLLPNAFVFAPIKDVTTNELWQYLMQVPAPWGGTHKELVTLYKNSNSGDCPLVIDDSTPSCGNSRFGCWVCTVVQKDKSMEGLIESGEDWMEPLLEFRDLLIETREQGHKYRSTTRRNGQKTTEGTYGPLYPSTRAMLLERLLEAQKEIQENQGEMFQFISYQELTAIQLQWYRDGYFEKRVNEILNDVYNQQMVMDRREKKIIEEEKILKQVFSDSPQDVEMIKQMLHVQKTKDLMIRKRGLVSELEQIIEKGIKTA